MGALAVCMDMLKSLLHRCGTLGFSFADEPCDGGVLHSGLLYAQREVLEVLVGSLSKQSHVLLNFMASLLPECLRALKHRQFSYRICSQSSYLRRIPFRIWIRNICFAVSFHVGSEMIFQLFPIHRILEDLAPADFGGSFQIGCAVAVNELNLSLIHI